MWKLKAAKIRKFTVCAHNSSFCPNSHGDWFEPPYDKTNKVAVHPVWSESSMCAQWVARDPSFFHADSEDSDQTGPMPRLVWVFAGCTVILLALSWGGSFTFTCLHELLKLGVNIWYLDCVGFQPKYRGWSKNTNEPWHDKTNKVTVHPAKTQISLGICLDWLGRYPGWSESLLGAHTFCWFCPADIGHKHTRLTVYYFRPLLYDIITLFYDLCHGFSTKCIGVTIQLYCSYADKSDGHQCTSYCNQYT